MATPRNRKQLSAKPSRPEARRWAWFAILVIAGSAGSASLGAPPGPEVERRIDALLARMTIEEKVGQLQQVDGFPDTGRPRQEHFDLARRGLIGSLMNVRGAGSTNGLQRVAVEESRLKIPLLYGFDVIHGYRTIFPIPLGLASSWDPAAVERASAVGAAEASASGVRWTFAPMLAVARDPRWGRISESSGEDPYLASAMARASVRGFQGTNDADPTRLVACAKHWVAYSAAEGGRDYNAADLSERTLRSVYFPPFKAALDAGAATVMSSLNAVNDVPATANPFLLTDVLRREWKFDGLVISDYKAVEQLIAHGVAADPADAARQSIAAGIDMEEMSRLFGQHLPKLVADGKLPVATIDEAVRRVLRVKSRAGLFERPYVDQGREGKEIFTAENLAAAREVAGRCLVLLKNEGPVLPLGNRPRTIALIGPLADDRQSPMGHWLSDGRAGDVVSVLAALRSKAANQPGATKVAYAKGCEVEGGTTEGFAEAVGIAREADVAVLVLGESSEMSGEASSRSSIGLPGHQLGLVQAVHATGKPTVVVLMNGRPLAIPWVADHVPAILEAWLGGTQSGPAIVDALFGDVNPGGKLPATFPRAVGQVPLYYNHANTGRPATHFRYTSKYIDIPIGPQFPFGHGLSYTRFHLKELSLDARQIPPGGRVTASVVVENLGDRAGDEVVQLYLRDEVASVTRPVRELCGFERVTLRPGEAKTVRFSIGPEELGLYDRQMRFVVEPGGFRVTAGTSSVGGLETTFEVVER